MVNPETAHKLFQPLHILQYSVTVHITVIATNAAPLSGEGNVPL